MKRVFRLSLLVILCTVIFSACAHVSPHTGEHSEMYDGNDTRLPEINTDETLHDTVTPKTDTESDEKSEPENPQTITTPSAFEQKQCTLRNGTIRYWMYTPADATENMPLIVYLHGGSGKGDDLVSITAVDGFPQYLRDGRISVHAYVVIPQVPSSRRGWGDMKVDVMELIAFVQKEYTIDENRISLTGHSMGGTGAWMLALAYPDTFSAVAPLSGSVSLTEANIQKLKDMPVWAIVGTEDRIVEPQSSMDFISELSKVNAHAKLTVLDGADHFAVPGLCYLSDELDLVEWLICQVRE